MANIRQAFSRRPLAPQSALKMQRTRRSGPFSMWKGPENSRLALGRLQPEAESMTGNRSVEQRNLATIAVSD